MHESILSIFSRLRARLLDETGQDLVEYGLTMAVVALGGIAGISALAQSMSHAFLVVGNLLSSSIT